MLWSEAVEVKVGEIFKILDKDGSGTVSAKEFMKGFRSVCNPSADEAAGFVAEMDADGVIVLF